MRETHLALAIVMVALVAPAHAQDPIAVSGVHLPYESLRYQTGEGRSAKTLTVKNDGTYELDTSGKSSTGTLTPNQWYEIAVAARRADFAGQDGKKLGANGTPFTISATGDGRTLSVSGADGTESLATFNGIVRTLGDFTYEKTRWFPGLSLFKPKIPAALELTLEKNGQTSLELVVLDDKTVQIKSNGRTIDATLTPDEEAALARAVRGVDDTGFVGDASWGAPAAEQFKIVTYETFHEYLLRGNVGDYDHHPEVGAVMVALDTVLDRVARERAAASGNMFTDMLTDLGKTFDAMRSSGANPTAAPSRTPGIDGALIDAREHAATDEAKDAAER